MQPIRSHLSQNKWLKHHDKGGQLLNEAFSSSSLQYESPLSKSLQLYSPRGRKLPKNSLWSSTKANRREMMPKQEKPLFYLPDTPRESRHVLKNCNCYWFIALHEFLSCYWKETVLSFRKFPNSTVVMMRNYFITCVHKRIRQPVIINLI